MPARLRPDTFTLLLILSVILAAALPARGNFNTCVDIATTIGIGLLFFLHGARLSHVTIVAGMTHWRLHLMVLASTFILFPILGLTIGLLVPTLLSPALYAGLLFLCLLPSTVQSSIALTSMARGNVPAAVCSATASNILGMFMTPILVGLLFHRSSGTGISFSALEGILLQLLMPFILGQALRSWLGGFLVRHSFLTKVVDRGSILLVVYLAFSNAIIAGLWGSLSLSSVAILLAIDSLLLGTVLATTVIGSRMLGFAKEDEITIAFCGSKKSLASGVPMANIIFRGQDVGAIILPLMLFHQMQLMVCAALARRYASRR